MTHVIINQYNKHIQGKDNIEKVKDMLHNSLDYTYIDNKKVEVYSDQRFLDGSRRTIVLIEGIDNIN